MDLLLLVVTVAAVGLAVVMTIAAWRAHEEQRQRSDARVAALAAAIDGPAPDARENPWLAFAGADDETVPSLPAGGRIDSGDVAARPLFAGAEETGATRRAWLPAAAGAAGLVLLLVLLLSGGGGRSNTEATAAPAAHPLELVSLRHEGGRAGVTVSGVVRNPRGARPLDRVTAVVFFFDGSGGYVASARAPLETPQLAPGAGSPFTVTLAPAPSAIDRYRVSFRREQAGMIPHVDRREGS